jgi:hypothetical protein
MWIVGSVFDYMGIAIIGATVILGTGAIVASSGLEYKTGETRIEESTNKTVVSNEYSSIDTPRQLSLGGLWMLFGGLLAIQKLSDNAL